ncbi:MAG: hypothetical protein R3F49_02400 [Planctomycetota bacterium]
MPRPLFHRVVGALLWWSPVWAPLALALQLSVRGLDPARRERSRLQAEVPVVVARNARSAAKVADLEAAARAWQDPVYVERVRKLRASARRADGPVEDPSQPAQGGPTAGH